MSVELEQCESKSSDGRQCLNRQRHRGRHRYPQEQMTRELGADAKVIKNDPLPAWQDRIRRGVARPLASDPSPVLEVVSAMLLLSAADQDRAIAMVAAWRRTPDFPAKKEDEEDEDPVQARSA